MGCGGSTANTPELLAQKDQNAAIEKGLADAKKSMGQEVKILLLGAGASGKSTIAKQMKLLYLEGFSDKEASIFTEIVFFNIIKNMKTLVQNSDKFGYVIDAANKETAEELKNMTIQLSDVELTAERGEGIAGLWNDKAIQDTLERASEFQLDDSASYFFKNLDRIAKDGYKPSTQDILHVRAKTTGIVETEFVHEGLHFRMVDVGGQRNERKKWIHCFQEVTAIIFVVAVSEYDQKLEEDLETNRMSESLKLFDDVVNNRWFATTSVILFLNKKDLFELKIMKTSLKVAFPQFDGPEKDYDAGMAYILRLFLTTDQSGKKREIYSHETCATDTENIRVVFGSVEDIFLTGHLDAMGY